MAVKYQCPKCEKRYVEWGAEKLEFKCPECEEKLELMGGASAKPKAKAKRTLKRKAKPKKVKARALSASDYNEDVEKEVLATDGLVIVDDKALDGAMEGGPVANVDAGAEPSD